MMTSSARGAWIASARWCVVAGALHALAPACGVARYRVAPIRADLELRLVDPAGRALPRLDGAGEERVGPDVLLSSEHVRQVRIEETGGNAPRRLFLDFNEDGRALLAQVTERHRGERIALVVDGLVVVAPRIEEPITDGVAQLAVSDDDAFETAYQALTAGRAR
ncbi:MAG: hypothetical protein ACFCGT_24245 [Sandaracinaceae bacterium]